MSEKQNSTLTIKLHDVNIRLFKNNPEYRKLIYIVADYVSRAICMKFHDYAKLKGMSGANLGIPFNIIAINSDKEKTPKIMINPKILEASTEKISVSSNCGSLLLKENIEVERHEWVFVEYYDLHGSVHKERFTREDNGFTIQHEIFHNLGKTIKDMEKKNS
jgi:peptide deformylase